MVEKGIRYDAAVQDFEKFYISRVMERVKGNQSRAARLLGMHRNTLSRKIGEYGLPTDFRNRTQVTPVVANNASRHTVIAARPLAGAAMQASAAAGRGADSGSSRL